MRLYRYRFGKNKINFRPSIRAAVTECYSQSRLCFCRKRVSCTGIVSEQANTTDDEARLSLAYSPCPNDTFMFGHIAEGALDLPGITIETHLRDVETLNRNALQGRFDVSKVSFHAYWRIRDHYRLLENGAALGFGCGPLVVASETISRDDLRAARIAVPGELTTAHLLLRLWLPAPGPMIFVAYDQILPLLREARVDAGVIIHESRFVYEQAGMTCIEDLGRWWEQETGLPIPLGCMVANRRLGDALIQRIDALLKASIQRAHERPAAIMAYVRAHAQEMSDAVLAEHIGMFVNDFSAGLGVQGRRAIDMLERMARAAGVMS